MGGRLDVLIITADDFGLANEVNEAVEIAHRNGILSAASLMVGGLAANDAVARARKMPKLRVGLHLVLTEGRPLLPAAEIRDLVDGDGLLRTDLVRFGMEIAFRKRVRRQIAGEIKAQFEAFAGTGLTLDHVNAHMHYHLHPSIMRLVLDIGRDFGVPAIRVPAEPTNVLRRAGGRPRWTEMAAAAPWVRLLRRLAARQRLVTTGAVFGAAWSGAVTADRLTALILGLPPGPAEIYLHPATADEIAGGGPGYRHREELDALIDPAVREALEKAGRSLGGYSDISVGRPGEQQL